MAEEKQAGEYVKVWHWQCPTCFIISGQWCSPPDLGGIFPPESAPCCCYGDPMVKTMERVRVTED